MRKIYIVPNIITTANMFCGFFSVISSMDSRFISASWAILVAAVFDMLDGRIARLAKATSQFGVEYDSLSDLLSFGIAPAVLIYQWSLTPFEKLGWIAAFLFVLCGALRLARFNVNVDTVSKAFFQGLPIPIAAGVIATFIIFSHNLNILNRKCVSLLMALGLAGLMVSTIQFPSFKELNWRSRASFGYLLMGVLSLILIAISPEITLFLILAIYIVLSLVWNVLHFMRRPKDV